ncbi:2-oxo-4-hydroxy-4-carboxy-5-ureidoimidazoline decarboxylase [Murinocardiopsis flavida]|uniref:2-oxo-4-hydroxy-4-carboxy-5-ureidoimidazoline decarboxylase n=1 Tax=Murinocardiopsis flavida TaxID=645275 RepID=A0A2P8D2A3_9ACTN|nr:2-oxo-4-hydroxy-4-carboxy-5-ureidoimidazoline decarboxylase [Murinocardiopsis flavida]PSK91329.1 2-oxo-4-hydroxy-4-carboxy-5-ureidoimidazoline decarboxylase [Murinocardiopsis flavida]
MPDRAAAPADPAIERLNALGPEEFRAELAQCLDIDRWVRALDGERPFRDRDALIAAAGRHAAAITDDEVAQALARHPRIGQQAAPAAAGGTEAAWSRGEQAGVTGAAKDDFRAANAAYEERFGQIYLVCASGRSGPELLADLTARMANDPAAEARVVAGELGKIALLRLERLLDRQ